MRAARAWLLAPLLTGCGVGEFRVRHDATVDEGADVAPPPDASGDAWDDAAAPDVRDGSAADALDAEADADAPGRDAAEDADARTDAAVDAAADVVPACPAGQTRCAGACVDLAADLANCAACGHACDAGLRCAGSRCVGPITQWGPGEDSLCVVRSTGEVECVTAGGVLTPVAGITDAVEVDAGRSHTCVRRRGGAVACWGSNFHGALGNDTTVDSATPVVVYGLNDATRIAVGSGYHACALRAAGTVVCWGHNSNGQVGDGTTTDRWTPTAVGLTGVTALDVGAQSTCAQVGTTLQCWGGNSSGMLATGSTTPGDFRTRLAAASVGNVRQFSLYFTTACARLGDGTALCWGDNRRGALGIDMTEALRSTGTPTAIVGVEDVEEVQVGDLLGCARRATGSIFCWGGNSVGQCGDGMTSDYHERPVNVVGLTGSRRLLVGGTFALAIMEDGSVVSWGANVGQFGPTAGPSSRFAPVVLR